MTSIHDPVDARSTTTHFILDGYEVRYCRDHQEWLTWWSAAGPKRVVALSALPSGTMISTVFLGFERMKSNDRDDPPQVFETVVKGGPLDKKRCTYGAFYAAQIGHGEVLAEVVRTELPPPKDGKLCPQCGGATATMQDGYNVDCIFCDGTGRKVKARGR